MPVIAQSAFSKAIWGTLYIKMITETMEEDWDESEKNSMVLLCMTALGVGEIVGSIIFARLQDSCSMTVTLGVILLITLVGCFLNMFYVIVFVFNPYLCTAMTFAWGMQDAAVICLINTMCGFEFESKTTPFSVFKLSQAIFLFLIFGLESLLKTKEHYTYYFTFQLCFAVFAYVFLKCNFKFKETSIATPETASVASTEPSTPATPATTEPTIPTITEPTIPTITEHTMTEPWDKIPDTERSIKSTMSTQSNE